MRLGKVGVIGAGNMGSGIAQRIAQEGINVILVDVEERFLAKGMASIEKTLDEGAERGLFTPEVVKGIMSHIHTTTELKELEKTSLVIEAIFEDLDVKRKLFSDLDQICSPKTVLASNTSSFSISELAEAVDRKDRFVGLHFFYHPAKNRLLEVIPWEETSPETMDLAFTFSKTIGKTAINVKDAPGFAVNRFFVPWLNEAVRLHEEGIPIATIDETAKKVFNIGMGPFKLMNVTGIPIAYHSTVSLGKQIGDFYGPCNLLEEQFESGNEWDLSGEPGDEGVEKVEKRLLGVAFTVACHLVEEGVASLEDTDRGAKIGLRWSSGPYEMMNDVGTGKAREIVEEFTSLYPDMEMPRTLAEIGSTGDLWEINFIDLVIKDDIARIIFNRPEAMNAINETVMKQLDLAFSSAEANPSVKAIILEGSGKAFVAGADIGYFVEKIKADRIADIIEFTRYGHSVLNRIDSSSKLVIAKLDGLSLGGGTEIALTADVIVGSEKGSIGFPETGIGIYPGLGGTQRTTKYVGKELAKYLIFTGASMDARTAHSIGLIEYLASSHEIDERIDEIIHSRSILTKETRKVMDIPPHMKAIRDLFSDANLGDVMLGGLDLDEAGKKLAKKISYKAPIAIDVANRLIEEGAKVDLPRGLELELSNLELIFSTNDALEGLTSVLERRRPTFEGK